MKRFYYNKAYRIVSKYVREDKELSDEIIKNIALTTNIKENCARVKFINSIIILMATKLKNEN